MSEGIVEVVTRYFVSGWAANNEHGPVHVQAECRGQILGVARAGLTRPDLNNNLRRLNAFIVVFSSAISAEDVHDVKVRVWSSASTMPNEHRIRHDTRAPCQIFIVGSPRSGTSELGATLAAQLDLPWLGEGHAAPAFATAADALKGDAHSPDNMLQFMAEQRSSQFAQDAARQVYYVMHGSASFLDKTPGVPMILATPFLSECFPTSFIIFLRRNGISNVLSRMAKFGGDFEDHCCDWAGAMDAWEQVKTRLPHHLEIEQEHMLADAAAVGAKIAAYVGRPKNAEAISASLRTGSHERTGAGLGKNTIESTGWSSIEVRQFKEICGPTMARWGYAYS